MDFVFLKKNKIEDSSERALLHLTIDPDTLFAKFDLDLDSIPGSKLDGFEVIADFQVLGFDNQQTFWTDSNGLEMQKRILNYRPTWNLQDDYNIKFENVTANYFPINSAVSMRDGSRVFTVCNDRA